MTWATTGLLVLVGLTSGGCMFFTSRKEGDELERRVKKLGQQVDDIHKQGLLSLRKELAELKEILPQARTVLLQNSARFGLQLERVSGDVDRLKGQVANLVTDLEGSKAQGSGLKTQVTRLGEAVEQIRIELSRLILEVRRKPSPEPSSPAELFARATIRRLAGKYPEARTDYQNLIQRFPSDQRVEEAYLRIAETHYAAYEFKAAAAAVAALLKAKPAGRFEAAARLLSAKSHMELKDCLVALRILTRLVQTHPQDEIIPEARRLIANLQRVQRSPRFCRP
ncbi:MAG: tetratricopeptide repeat protein [Polyangia bacterium]|nr:tetratricopeptide repeat protein [Polyangia bacterium]